MTNSYYVPRGGLPSQSTPLKGRAVFTDAYAFIPAETYSDIVTSYLPHWDHTRAWIIARPLSGFAETFTQYIVEVSPNGGSKIPDTDPTAQSVLFVVDGEIIVTINGEKHSMGKGGYAYLPAGCDWSLLNQSNNTATFHWLRKRYEHVDGIETPSPFVTNENTVPPREMPDCDGVWATTRFVEPDDLRHDMHVNIVTFQNGGLIPFEETHVMEHGLYVLQGTARYLLNQDWVDVGPGDFMWLRAFCPQACVATSDEPFRYLLYKDVNRHPKFAPFGRS
ncbi:(S)-ureidoglycine aminohydrolase [Amylibacter kogurei]|uniref:(S)-ureidoglycine aminohydrolase n=1 Tax=Paramylibacter kogurei TaxID=1889778 RepID=A0A2G5K6S6_9RHOB|nr:bifunctional allantoicase/(S)-ureidoglycine aminohydrolase [Amylibacter kogurei]PIB24702.1 (S)-ureidoglycine aminohydrolase [Amylibacter kogurei]